MSNYLVTGQNGFIGKHLVKAIHAEGHTTADPYTAWDRGGELGPHIDAVVHLGGLAGVHPDKQDAREHFEVNTLQTINLLDKCVNHNIKKFIYISSSAVYGDNTNRVTEKIEEEVESSKPLCPYAASKKAGELICHSYHHNHGIDVTILRLFTVYGPGQKTEMAIPLFTRLIEEDKPVTIYGHGYRDYVYVDDAVHGILQAIRHCSGYEIYNIGSGEKTYIMEILTSIEKALYKKGDAIIVDNPKGYAENTLADISKARRQIGYRPLYRIKVGIREYIEWRQSNVL